MAGSITEDTKGDTEVTEGEPEVEVRGYTFRDFAEVFLGGVETEKEEVYRECFRACGADGGLDEEIWELEREAIRGWVAWWMKEREGQTTDVTDGADGEGR